MNCVGLIIGKSGVRVAGIAKKWNVKINAPRKNNHPIFEIFGVPHRIQGARNEIEAIMAQWMTESSSKQ
jgi:hypothetical protein